MKPACGNGTWVMTLRLNQPMSLSWASLLTAVGLERVSIGPPIRIIDSGTLGSFTASMRDDRGEHRHRGLADRDHVGVAAQRVQHLDDVVDVVVEVERAGGERHHPGVLPVGDVDVVVGQQRLDRAAQQRRVVAGHRRHQQHLRVAALAVGRTRARNAEAGRTAAPTPTGRAPARSRRRPRWCRGPTPACRSGGSSARTSRTRRRWSCRPGCATAGSSGS